MTKVENSIPILGVKDIKNSLAFYIEKLGFKLDWQTPTAAQVSRDEARLMLVPNARAATWIGAEDIDPLMQEFAAKGVKPSIPPINRPWAYEMSIRDPDGNVLRFGSEPKASQPVVR